VGHLCMSLQEYGSRGLSTIRRYPYRFGAIGAGMLAEDMRRNPGRYWKIAKAVGSRVRDYYRSRYGAVRPGRMDWEESKNDPDYQSFVPRGRRRSFRYMRIGSRAYGGVGRRSGRVGSRRRRVTGKRRRRTVSMRGRLSKKAKKQVKLMVANRAMWTKWNRHFNIDSRKYESGVNEKQLHFVYFNVLTTLNGYIDSHFIEFPSSSASTTLTVNDLRGRDVLWNIKSNFSVYMKNNYGYKTHVDLYWFVAKTNTGTTIETLIKGEFDNKIVDSTGTSFLTADSTTWESFGLSIKAVLSQFKRYYKLLKHQRVTIPQTMGHMFKFRARPRFFNSREFTSLTSSYQVGLTYECVWHQWGEVAHSDVLGEEGNVGYSSSLLDVVIRNDTWLRLKYPKQVNPVHRESVDLGSLTVPSVATLALQEQDDEEIPPA